MIKVYNGIHRFGKKEVIVGILNTTASSVLNTDNTNILLSIEGFDWGCNSIGTAQLAISLIKDLTNDEVLAINLQKKFRETFLQYLPTTWRYTETFLLKKLEILKS